MNDVSPIMLLCPHFILSIHRSISVNPGGSGGVAKYY